jgi:ankyrin repeat protein
MKAAVNRHKDIVDMLLAHNCDLDLRNEKGENALILAASNDHFEIVALIVDQLRRNRNWDHRKALMLVLAGSNYLPRSSPSSSTAVVDTGRVVQREDAALTTSSEKVSRNILLVRHIMRYI